MGMGKGVKPGFATGASSVSYRHNFLFFFFFWGGGEGGGQENWPFTLREHWKITHYF